MPFLSSCVTDCQPLSYKLRPALSAVPRRRWLSFPRFSPEWRFCVLLWSRFIHPQSSFNLLQSRFVFGILLLGFLQRGENFSPISVEFSVAVGIADSHGAVCGVDEGFRLLFSISTPQHIDHGAIFNECHTFGQKYHVQSFIIFATPILRAIECIDVFLVGGGGGGASPSRAHSGGGGGGYTTTGKNIMVSVGTPYVISIGSGGAIDGDGGNTAAFKLTANGGRHGNSGDGEGGSAAGGDGGSGGGSGSYGAPANGGSNGSDGDAGAGKGGVGQHTTTREFAGTAGKLYAGGGGGGNYFSNGGHDGTGGTGGAGGGGNGSSKSKGLNATAGENNTGGGGGGGSYSMQAAKGGSGIVIIRNKR